VIPGGDPAGRIKLQAGIGVAARRNGLRRVEALLDVGGAIARQHFCCIGPVRTFKQLDLFSAPFFRGYAKFGSDLVGIDQLLSEARRKWNCRGDRDQKETPDHFHSPGIFRLEERSISRVPEQQMVKQVTIAH
jgi:hypothetical protein